MKDKKPNYPFLWFTKITGLPLFAFFKLKIYCEDNDKSLRHPKKPCIIMSNHTSLFDFALHLALFYFRTVRFLMAEVLFDGRPVLSRFLYAMGGIRVDRDAYDFSFVGKALDILDRGGTVGIFPEGRLPRGEKNQKRKSSQRAQPLHEKFQLLFFLKRKSKFQSRLLSYHRRLGSRSTILGIRAIPECRSHSTRCPFFRIPNSL